MRRAITVTIGVDAPDATAAYAQHLFDELLDFFQANVVLWQEENENGLQFQLSVALR
jgi:hypothetical protein